MVWPHNIIFLDPDSECAVFLSGAGLLAKSTLKEPRADKTKYWTGVTYRKPIDVTECTEEWMQLEHHHPNLA